MKVVKKNNAAKGQANDIVATLKVRVSRDDGSTELALTGQLVGAQIDTALEALAEAAGNPDLGSPAATDLACG